MRGTLVRRGLAVLAAAGAVVAMASPAYAARVVNGDFERGNLSGFEVRNTMQGTFQSGNWYAYGPTKPPPVGACSAVPPPPQGRFAATTAQSGPGAHVLFQNIALEANAKHRLSFTLYYQNFATGGPIGPIGDLETEGLRSDQADRARYDSGPRAAGAPAPGFFATPPTLDPTVQPNQQYRVDILKPSADPFSVDESDVLARVFRTEAGDPAILTPTRMSFDLSRFAGQTVRLRFAEVDNQSNFCASVDDIDVRTQAEPQSECTINGTPGNDIIRGSSGDDVICGGGGNDIIYGLGGNDELRGGDGNDVLRGGPGNDKLEGGRGNDQLLGGDGRDRLTGGPGSDDLSGQGGADSLDTRDDVRGNDVANGGPGDDSCATDPRDVRSSC